MIQDKHGSTLSYTNDIYFSISSRSWYDSLISHLICAYFNMLCVPTSNSRRLTDSRRTRPPSPAAPLPQRIHALAPDAFRLPLFPSVRPFACPVLAPPDKRSRFFFFK